MNSRLAFSVLASLAFVQAQSADQPVINTPTSLAQCLPSQLSFSGGTGPYTITVIPGGQVNGATLADLGTQAGPNYTWKVNIAAGTSITLQIRDSKGVLNYAQAVTVQPSSDSSCLTSGGSSAAQSSPASPTTPAAPVSTGSATTSPASTNTSTTPASTTPAAGTNTTSKSQPNTTAPATNSSSTASTSTSASPTANQTKGPSVFTPTTSAVNNSSSASSNAPNSAAPATGVHYSDLLTGLGLAGAVLTIFA